MFTHSFIRLFHLSLFGVLNLYPSGSDLKDALTALSRLTILTPLPSLLSQICFLSIIIYQNHKKILKIFID